MVKKRIIIFMFFLVVFTVKSQTIQIKGFVKDSLQNPLSFANIIAKPKETAKNMAFTITNEQGKYSLTLKKGILYTISVSYMGYKTVNIMFLATKKTTKNFILKEKKNTLEEVVVELPVSVKEDTITYNTSKFTNGKERKLKNILKKLPGVEVNKKGQVTVMGKRVTKLLVDDKPFFGGNTKLGVENIPADAVDKVQAIDNYNEVGFLKGISDSDKMALNVTLKEDKKRFVFGDIEAGKGNKSYYKTHANLFYYSPKTNVNFIGNLNNIGEKTFTFRDYFRFSGGINNVFNANFDFRGGNFQQFLQNEDILKTKHQFGALNITQTASSSLDVSGYAIFSHTDNDSFSNQKNQYTKFTENKENTTNLKNTLAIGKFSIDHAPNNTEQWYFRTQIKQTNNYKHNLILSEVDKTTSKIQTNQNDKATYINQNVEWHQKKSSKHTFSVLADYTFDKNYPNTFWLTTNPILQGLIPINKAQDVFNIQQQQQTEQHYFNTTFKHFWLLNRFNHIYTTLGNVYQNQRFLTNDFQILDNTSQNNFNKKGFGNHLDYNFHDFFVGVHYKFRKGIFTLKQGAYLHRYEWNVNQKNKLNSKKWVVLPDFKAEVKFSNSKKINLNYALKTTFANVSKLSNRFYLQSYNSVFMGDETLTNELYHKARVYYSRFSLYRGLMLMLNVDYTKKVEGFRNTVNFDGINRFLSYELISNPYERWSFRANIRKRIKKIRYHLLGSYSNAEFLQKTDNKYVTNKNNNYSFEIGAETLFSNFPVIELGYKRSIGNYISNNTTSMFVSNEPFVSVDYDFLKGFKFNFEYTYYDYQNKTQNAQNTYKLAEGSLLYQKEDSPFTFKILAKNLFNTKLKQQNSFSDYLISDTQTYIMPRVFMFSLGYKL